MKKYFIYQDGKQSDAYSFEELKDSLIEKDTFVWYEGLDNWQRAGEFKEFDDLWINRKVENNTNEKSTNGINVWFVGVSSVIIVIILGWHYFKSNTGIAVKTTDEISESKSSNLSKKEQLELMENGCFYTDLSEKYNFRVVRNVREKKEGEFQTYVFIVTIIVYDKETNEKVDIVNFTSENLYSDVYENCNSIRSFSTGRNKNNDVIDWDWGDFVVADFNFDSKDDFAVKKACYNASIIYDFYIQDAKGNFIRDKYHYPIEYRLNLKTN